MPAQSGQEKTTPAAQSEEPAAEDTGSAEKAEENPSNAIHDKFKAALARKNQQNAQRHNNSRNSPLGMSGEAHGPAAQKRTFRRKSG